MIRYGPGSIVDLGGVLTFQGPCSLGPPPPVTVIYDSFTGTNGTLLSAHAPDINTPGGAWTQLSGTTVWSIQSNQLVTTGADVSYVNIESGNSDCTIQVTFPTYSVYNLAFRITDASNMFYVRNNAFSRTSIYEIVGGSTFQRAQSGIGNPGYPVVLKVVLIGSSITAYAIGTNNTYSVSYSSSNNLTKPKHGIGVAASGTGPIDDFEVTAASGGAPSTAGYAMGVLGLTYSS